MLKSLRLFTALLMAALVVPAGAGAAEGQGKPAAPAPKTVQCVPLRMIRQTRILDDKTILFEMRSGEIWRNELPYDCHGLKREDRFGYKTSMDQLCSTDLITVLPTMGIAGPTCGLGEFVLYTPEKQKEDKK